MDNFIVSARKYRPQTFDTVVGQATITNTLKNAIRHNQLAQAFLFCGPRGVGKTTCARILAKTINCEHLSPSGEACDQCQSCTSFNENSSFNIYELDGASNNSVDDIRTLVDQVRIPPQMGKYKVYIIDEVHMLSPSAFNAFLKTLEEPPPYAKFILATTEKHKIIPTILSRCQIFDFRRITADDMVGHLMFVAGKENISIDENALHIIAQKADGAMRDALSIFDQLVSFAGNDLKYSTVIENLNVLDYEYYFRISDQILNADIAGTLLTIDNIIGKGFDGQHFLTGFGEHLRNLLVCKDPSTLRLMETAPSIRNRYAEQAARFQASHLLTLLDIGNRCDLAYKISNNKRIHLELALMQMCSASNKVPAVPKQRGVQAAPQTVITPQPPASQPPPATPAPYVVPARENQTTVVEKPRPAAAAVQATVKLRDLKETVSGTISIKQAVKPKDSKAEVLEDPAAYSKATPFTQEDLNAAWKEYVTGLKSEMPHLYNSLAGYIPILKDNFNIEITLENKLLETDLFRKKGEMLGFLRSRLDNYQLSLTAKVEENSRELKPYTDKEKFDKMAAKNPALQKLKEELDLEIEY
ncbi:MAG: DNA polymerase III subunit gamma/tau [Bacteroidetes bacterium]|nr:DNA polymerase III subunit gamma/tau [Bacteroidota bacterium]